MSQLRVIICRVEDDEHNKMSELASFDLPQHEIDPLRLPQTLDDLEQQTFEMGNPILQKIMQVRWEETDQKLTQEARQSFSPSECQKRRKQTP